MSQVEETRRGLITFGLMVATFVGALDATVVNVSLPHIQGNLSASAEQITWVLTSYMVASAMATPISGWLAGRIGLKPMVIACIGLFTASSVLCGLAVNLPEMILLRIVQGITFAPIPPLAQAVLLKINPPERYGRAMAAFSMATVAGPIIGPALGGYITDQFSWRWCFYMNLGPGIAAMLLLWFFLPREPIEVRRFDFLGFGSLALAIGALQLLLDRGPSQDWFGSREICIYAIIVVTGFWVYLAHTLTAREPLFDPSLARDRNFVTGTIVLFLVMLVLFGSIALLPLMTQNLMGYPAGVAGLLNMPRALVIMATLQIVGRLDAKIDRRVLAIVGVSILTVSFWRMENFDLAMGPGTIVAATVIQGLGQGFLTVPITTLALATVRPSQRTDASTVINLMRGIGGSVGVSMMQGLITVNTQVMHASLAAQVRPEDAVVRAGLPAALSPSTAAGAFALNTEITRQATMVAFIDNYRVMVITALACVPLLLLLRQPRQRAAAR
jgi:DHA2 family multidrug resistance protein